MKNSSIKFLQYIALRLSMILVFGILMLQKQFAEADNQAIFIGGAQTNESNFAPYLNALEQMGVQVNFQAMNSNPFTADHGRDLELFQEKIAATNSDAILFLGYSVGAKFASRLAVDFAQSGKTVTGLVLLDPVGGQPPFQNDPRRFPDFLNDSHLDVAAKIPTLVFSSQFGPEKGPLNVPCVTPGYGSPYFIEYFSNAKGVENLGSGHTDYLSGSLSLPLTVSCKRGTISKQELQIEVVESLAAAVAVWLENKNDND